MNKTDKIYVAGHRGMVGSAIVRKLEAEGFKNLLLRTHDEVDLINQTAVADFFEKEKPEHVFLAAAKVGGIVANSTYPAEFIYDNLMIQTNVIHHAWRANVKRLLFLGSTCIYPKQAPQPMKEECLLTGPLEPTNRPYALAKIAGIEICRSYNRQYGTRFLAAMPTNLYGPNDNFDLETSHVLPALIRKFHEAKVAGEDTVTIWGTGSPYREFLHVGDLADGAVFLMNLPENEYTTILADPDSPALINIGSGEELAITDLALLVKRVIAFNGELVFDTTKPDGTPRKLCDVSRLHALGWRNKIKLENGIRITYEWFMHNRESSK
ncbi:MAG: GDP-L-fucose synthase family protein [Planctomycetota bacterium]|jgi:GDP-L-fucose synthase